MSVFPNAAKGVKKIFVAEIMALIGAILLGTGIVFGIDGLFGEVVWMEIVSIVFIFGSAVLLLIAYINNMVGLGQASRDDQGYKVALWMMIISMILSILFTIFEGLATTYLIMNMFCTSALFLANLLEMFSILVAIRTTEKLLVLKGDALLAATGEASVFLMIVPFLITALLRIITIFTPNFIDMILSIAATVIVTFGYIMYLSFLSAARIRLAGE